MKKSGTLYVGAIMILACGLWAVLACGARLHAPAFLGGAWEPARENTLSTAVPFTIVQSGRYLKVQAGTAPAFNLVWASETIDASGRHHIRLTGKGQDLIVLHAPATRPADSGRYEFRFEGRINGAWAAVRSGEGDHVVIPAQPDAH